MDENRKRSIVLFVLMGMGLFFAVLYAFVIGPRVSRGTLGSSDLVLEFPLNKKDLSYVEDGVFPFCSGERTYLGLSVKEDVMVRSSSDGVVTNVVGNVISIEESSGVVLEYFPVSNYVVFEGDYVTEGMVLGRVKGGVFNMRVRDVRREEFVCPYVFFSDFGRVVLDGFGDGFCECERMGF